MASSMPEYSNSSMLSARRFKNDLVFAIYKGNSACFYLKNNKSFIEEKQEATILLKKTSGESFNIVQQTIMNLF